MLQVISKKNKPANIYDSKSAVRFGVQKFGLVVTGSLSALLVLLVIYIGTGAVLLSPPEVVSAIIGYPAEPFHRQIVWELRFPRGLVAIMAGALLGLSGAILQSLTRNPLAEPGLTGVSSGGVLAVVLGLLLNLNFALLPLAALTGGLLSGGLVYLISRSRRDNGIEPLRLVLFGVVIGAICQALVSFLLLSSQNMIGSIFLWLIGSLNGRTWSQFQMILPCVLVGLPLGLLAAGPANVLHLGDAVALGLGQRVERARFWLFILAAFLAASAVSAVGAIGFIGLIAPHLARGIVGEDCRRLFVLSPIISAGLLIMADLLAQVVTKGNLPAGVITAWLGVPFFLYLTLRKK